GEAVRESVLNLIQQRIIDSGDSRGQMLASIRHHDAILHAIRHRDGRLASWLTRDGLYWYYHDYVEETARPGLRSLADEVRPADNPGS
ncbi:MAG TPA: hypothetical protein VFY83_00070, partial [Anaerolineales bacterium]|nr:hypothetical protein [Anaerolineales bacterium]